MIALRQMTSADIPAGLSLCRAAGWNQLSRDWELFLHLSPQGCCVATDEAGEVVGTVTTVSYENHFSWIGMVLVDPAYRKKGIGMQLLKESLQILRDDETVKLDATPTGREIYLKLHFIDEYPLSRMLCGNVSKVSSEKRISPQAHLADSDDFSKMLTLDREVFGADRKAVLEWSWKNSPRLAYVTREKNRITGFCLGRPGHNYMHIGPVVAHDVAQATQLVSAVLEDCLQQPVILDIAHHTPAWISWLSSIGFVEQRTFIRMYKGANHWPGQPQKQFAILGPEFG